MGIAFDEPAGEVEVALVDFVEADLGQGEPLVLEGSIEALEAGIVFGLMDAGKQMLDTEFASGSVKLTGELAAVVGEVATRSNSPSPAPSPAIRVGRPPAYVAPIS